MEQSVIYQKLTDIFHEVFDDESIVLTPETTAADIRDWDSANHVNLIVSIESRFKIRFKTTELESLHSIAHLVSLIEAKLSLKEAKA